MTLSNKMIERIREYALYDYISETNLSVDDAIELLSNGMFRNADGGYVEAWDNRYAANTVYCLVFNEIENLTRLCEEAVELAKEESHV